MCILLFGYFPFSQDDEARLKRGDEDVRPDYEDWDKLTEDSRDLISRMLKVKAKGRITAEEALRHPWISDREKVASSQHRNDHQVRLTEFNAQRKVRAAILAVRNDSLHPGSCLGRTPPQYHT